MAGRRVRRKCERLAADTNPNLILMNYDLARFAVTDLFFVPKQFFVREGDPGTTAAGADRPARGLGRLQHPAGRDTGSRQGVSCAAASRCRATRSWNSGAARCSSRGGRGGARLADRGDEVRRGDRARGFTLADVYASRSGWRALYPGNSNVRPKSVSSCRCCATRAIWSSWGAGGIGCGRCGG